MRFTLTLIAIITLVAATYWFELTDSPIAESRSRTDTAASLPWLAGGALSESDDVRPYRGGPKRVLVLESGAASVELGDRLLAVLAAHGYVPAAGITVVRRRVDRSAELAGLATDVVVAVGDAAARLARDPVLASRPAVLCVTGAGVPRSPATASRARNIRVIHYPSTIEAAVATLNHTFGSSPATIAYLHAADNPSSWTTVRALALGSSLDFFEVPITASTPAGIVSELRTLPSAPDALWLASPRSLSPASNDAFDDDDLAAPETVRALVDAGFLIAYSDVDLVADGVLLHVAPDPDAVAIATVGALVELLSGKAPDTAFRIVAVRQQRLSINTTTAANASLELPSGVLDQARGRLFHSGPQAAHPSNR